MSSSGEHCAFVLLAEFDIDKGAQLAYQFPQPLGTDEGLLANLMLPDGAEKQLEDWTIFFLNQTPFNSISPVLALEKPEGSSPNEEDEVEPSELLYVLNLVRTKHDKTVRRGAVVKAMAICTRHPFIQIFKPVLLMALDDYFSNPSQECLARLFDAVNAMDISQAPSLTRDEKLIVRVSERKDVFSEKFTEKRPSVGSVDGSGTGSTRDTLVNHHSNESQSSFSAKSGGATGSVGRKRADSVQSHHTASEASFSLGGSAVWVGDESVLETESQASTRRGRSSMDTNSASSHGMSRKEDQTVTATPYIDSYTRSISPKDTHFFSTSLVYKGINLPIKLPISTFPEEVGDYSLIQLIQMFSSSTLSGPQHPHLHTNGLNTHPIIILFNALITGKRIIFLGYQRPAGHVSSYVLAACALGSGCGAILRGFIARAFPYANLTKRDEWQKIPGYIAGVTNPIFEDVGSWDLLCDVGSSRMVVHKDIHANWPVIPPPPPLGTIVTRTGTLKAEGSAGNEEDASRAAQNGSAAQSKSEIIGKESADNLFMDDIVNAISCHFGEQLVRARFMEYVQRFVRLASRYEEEYYGQTKIGYPNSPFSSTSEGLNLGSGLIFADEGMIARELAINAYRIEGWRRTTMYENLAADFQLAVATKPIQGYDLSHQLMRLKNAKNMSDIEVELIMRSFVDSIQNYEQVVEFLANLPPYLGGLLPVTFCLFHQQESIRDLTIELLSVLRSYPIGIQFLQGLNHLHRYAYVRQAHAREMRNSVTREREQNQNQNHNHHQSISHSFHGHGQLYPPAPTMSSRSPSNRSESSLGGG